MLQIADASSRDRQGIAEDITHVREVDGSPASPASGATRRAKRQHANGETSRKLGRKVRKVRVHHADGTRERGAPPVHPSPHEIRHG